MHRLLAALLAALPAAAPAQEGPYTLETIDGKPFAAHATIVMDLDGKVSGDGPCNPWSAPEIAPYPWFEIGPVEAAHRACPDRAAEKAFFQALAEMTLSDRQGKRLTLENEAGRRMVFRATGDPAPSPADPGPERHAIRPETHD